MAGVRLGPTLRQMQALLRAGTVSGLSDGELLARFLGQRDEVAELAFAVLAERHGPMVLGVCRRILGDPHDAEDAFQATFLVLARKGRSVRVEGSLGRWLFGVATRVAIRARSDRWRRARERPGLDRVEAAELDASLAAVDRAEIVAAVTREIARLPGRFQAPVLLCDLEGASCEEAARRLGWPVGTVKSRLSRARGRLRERLTRRGLTPADLASLTIRLPAVPSPRLVEATTRAALGVGSGQGPTAAGISASVAFLTQGVLRTMLITRIKLAAAALLLVAIGSAVLFGQASAPKAGTAGGDRAPAAAGAIPKGGDQIDLEMLERAWADALARRDPAVVGRILADDFEGVDPAGSTFSRAAYLTYIADPAHKQFVDENQLVETKVRLLGETGVVVSLLRDNASGLSRRSTKVYARRRGRWQCVAVHAGQAGPTHAGFGEKARADWIKAWAEWRPLVEPKAAADKANCVSCHTPDVFHQAPIRLPGDPKPSIPAAHVSTICAPVECLIEKIRVGVGEVVKKGDPLLELSGAEIAAAKIKYRAAVSQWQRVKDGVEHLSGLLSSNLASEQELSNAEESEKQRRHEMEIARDRLLAYGMTDAEIAGIGAVRGRDRAVLTIRAPADGIVLAVAATLGNVYHHPDELIRIRDNPPRGDRQP